jgi:hypothetical protein
VRARVTAVLPAFRRAPGVTSVAGPYQAPGQISRDGHVPFATIPFGEPGSAIPDGEALAYC